MARLDFSSVTRTRDSSPEITGIDVRSAYIQAPAPQLRQHKITYNVSLQNITKKLDTLVDRGANGGLCGRDMRDITQSDRRINLTGIDNHEVVDLPIVTFIIPNLPLSPCP
jgi:hypothetical protein